MSQRNTLFYGDNLTILREHVASESVDLIYLDPPFNSARSYNVLFRDESGKEAESQITAFEDTWHWDSSAEETYHALVNYSDVSISKMIEAMRVFIGSNQMMAYLVMMAARLVELQRVLKPTGSIYLHCDPTASHYLKILLDTIFGPRQFRTEIVWKRSSAHSDTKQGRKQHGRIHDILLYYTKADTWTWNPVYTEYSEKYVEGFYRFVDAETGRRFRIGDLTAAKPGGDTQYPWRIKRQLGTKNWTHDLTDEYLTPHIEWEYSFALPYNGRSWAYSRANMTQYANNGRLHYASTGMPSYKRYLDEMQGITLQDIWDDVPPIQPQAAERLGYPTQKPLALLERIISASSNPGDVVLDPFCGCGTAIAAAQKLGRRWIGIDITHLSIALQKYRLKDAFNLVAGVDYDVKGEPVDYASAVNLAHDDKYQFQWWALSLINARPHGGSAGSKVGKKGADGGIDGVITFMDDGSGKAKRIVVQVKGGGVKVGDVRDLNGTLQREKAEIGVFISLEEPTQPMRIEALKAGYYRSAWTGEDYARIQLLTIQELLNGAKVKMPPPTTATTFRRAGVVSGDGSGEGQLGFDL